MTLTFFRLGKIEPADALFSVMAQFLGGLAGVLLAEGVIGAHLADPSVNYVVTTPGPFGEGAAFVAELGISFVRDVLSTARSFQSVRVPPERG